MKWMDLPPQERHTLLGELIDACVYNAEATIAVKQLVEQFREQGLIKSKILPNDLFISDSLPGDIINNN